MQQLLQSTDCSLTVQILEGYDYKIGGSAQTHYPQFRLKEEADSILVRYVSGLDEAKDVPGNIVQLKTVGETQDIRFPFVLTMTRSMMVSHILCKSMLETLQRMCTLALSKPTWSLKTLSLIRELLSL